MDKPQVNDYRKPDGSWDEAAYLAASDAARAAERLLRDAAPDLLAALIDGEELLRGICFVISADSPPPQGKFHLAADRLSVKPTEKAWRSAGKAYTATPAPLFGEDFSTLILIRRLNVVRSRSRVFS